MEISLNSGWGIVGTRQGVLQPAVQVNRVAEQFAQGDVTSARMVDLMTSEHSYAANARVIRSQDETVGYLLDVKR